NFPYRFSVNLSMKDMMDETLIAVLIKALEEDRETAKRLDIELLESEELFDLDRVIVFIKQIKSYGCRIAIDDFGSGYSNFAYVSALPIDILKIDGSLIRNMHESPRNLQAVKTIIAFAQNLKLDTVAEFVEDEATAVRLKEMGVTYAQGYHFGKPSETII
ncbi:MAG: diguanylate phosphodiesterase, partial [Epsilonproteobacteria bacterium]